MKIRPFPNRAAHRPAPHLLLVWLLSVPAVTPLIQPALSRSADGLLHLYRIVALDHAIHQGAFFPRWLPDLAYGYGLPLFVFYAPLSYYLSEGLNFLGLGPVGALNASFAMALFVSGAGVYLFVKDLFGSKAGVLAGVAYVYAPYQLFNVLWRGSLPIAWAGAIFPFVFWTFGRLIKTDKPVYLPLSAIVCGPALLVHNISSLIFLPLLALYLALELFARRDRRLLLRVGLALTLGVGLAAFFLGPAIVEKEFVQVERVITPPDFDYHFNFVNLKDLFTLPPPANTGLLNPDNPFTLGPAQVGLAAIGLLSLSLRLRRRAGESLGGPARQDGPLLTTAAFAAISLIVA
ncbi:MAG: 6-pyruvoyl-tetrahydropterin synthase-related protein, partial [Anaerolineales bacterium]